jgi:hypothetical protein
MTVTNSRQAYFDCYEVLDRALKDDEGIRVPKATEGEAEYFRLRLNKARVLDRSLNTQAYKDDPSHPLYQASEYDELIFTVRYDTEGKYWVYLQKIKIPEGIESLSEIE